MITKVTPDESSGFCFWSKKLTLETPDLLLRNEEDCFGVWSQGCLWWELLYQKLLWF
jgi:hypothetical protein